MYLLPLLGMLLMAAVQAPPLAGEPAAQIGAGLGLGQSPDEEQDPGADEEAPADEPSPLPPVAELVPRSVSLAQEADRAIETVREIADVSELDPRVDELAAQRQRVEARLDDALAQDYVRDERIEAILEQALFLQGQIDEAMAAAAGRVEQLDALRADWRGRHELWTGWREALQDDAQYETVYREQVAGALESIERVIGAAGEQVPGLVGLQQRLQEIDSASRDVAEQARQALQTWRRKLLQRSAPPLLGSEYRARLADVPETDLREALDDTFGDGIGLGGRHVAILALQIALALLLGWALRLLRRKVPVASRWAAVLDHPWAIGVLVATITLRFFYGPLPPVGRLLIGAVIAASTAMVAAGMFALRTKRFVVYAISAAYVLFAALEAVALPLPLLRLVLAGLALVGAPVLFILGRLSARTEPGEHRAFRIGLGLGAGILVLVFAAELAGYHPLAQWLLEAAVVTAFVGFVATFLLRLGRGGIYLALRSEGARRIGIPARIGGVLSDRLLFLLKVGIIGYGLLYLATVWNLADSPLEAWQELIGAHVTLGERDLTVGRLLLAALIVYLAVAASWVVRSFLDRAVFERRSFERGVRDSISTLLHYTLIVFGIFAALTLFGLDLSSLALIAGALSVGIGFGLQNVVNNFVSGLILLFERPVRVGDIVDVGPERGTISKIGLRSTVLTTFNGAEQIVPNGDLISEKVVNWTLTTPRARMVLPISVAYGNDPARVIQVLLEEGMDYELGLEDPAPMAIFTGFGESSLDFELRVWLTTFDQLLEARSTLAARVVRRLAEEGIEIPFPQRDLHLRSVTPEARGETERNAPGADSAPTREDSGAGSATETGADGDVER